MHPRQREILHALRSRDRAAAQHVVATAKAALDAARLRYETLDQAVEDARQPPGPGQRIAVSDEAHRRRHLAHLLTQQAGALAAVEAARAVLRDAQAALATRVGEVKAIDVLAERASEAERAERDRVAALEADERNRRGDDAL